MLSDPSMLAPSKTDSLGAFRSKVSPSDMPLSGKKRLSGEGFESLSAAKVQKYGADLVIVVLLSFILKSRKVI